MTDSTHPGRETQLQPDQVEALNEIVSFARSGRREHVLCGPAGTGKTYLLRAVADAVRALVPHIHFCATTNRAAHVAGSLAGVACVTIHSLLGLKPEDDHRTGRTRLKPFRASRIRPGALVVIDESSMIGRELLREIRSAANKVLYVGDSYQLPPVGEPDSPVFTGVRYQSVLTAIKRQALGNPIISTATAYRGVLDGRGWPEPGDVRGDAGHGVIHLARDDFDGELINAFDGADSSCVLLAWTNRRVRDYNRGVRRVLLGVDDDTPLAGEQLIVNSAIVDEHDNPVLGTGADVVVREVTATAWQGVPGTTVYVDTPDRTVFERMEVSALFVPEDWGLASRVLGGLAKKARELQRRCAEDRASDLDAERREAWRLFFDVKRGFHDLRPPYASTVHKAQGGTYETVFLDLDDIGRNTKDSDLARLMYVGITRASTWVVCTGRLPDRLYSLKNPGAVPGLKEIQHAGS